MLSNHLIFCCPLFLLPSVFPSFRIFSNESALHIRWPKYWSFNFSISSVRLLSRVQLFQTPWTAAHQASLSITNSWSPPKPMSIESVMPSSHLILCCSSASSPALNLSQHQGLFQWVSSSHQVAKVLSFSLTSVLPVNTQDWSLLGWTGWISLQSKGSQESSPIPTNHRRNQKRNKNLHRNEWKWKHNNPKPVGHYKSSPKGKVHSNTGIPQETRKKSNK